MLDSNEFTSTLSSLFSMSQKTLLKACFHFIGFLSILLIVSSLRPNAPFIFWQF
jgi:hypothetical protein